jgi:hypothetical protein
VIVLGMDEDTYNRGEVSWIHAVVLVSALFGVETDGVSYLRMHPT